MLDLVHADENSEMQPTGLVAALVVLTFFVFISLLAVLAFGLVR